MLVAIGAAVAVITGIGASTFPKSRIQSDSGLITSSITFSGAIIATGLAKLFSQPFVPFALIPATSTSTMLMIARQPEAKKDIRSSLLLGCALAEATAIYGLIVAILIIFFLK